MTTTTRHPPLTQLIHWLTALLVVAAFILGPEDLDEMAHPELDLGLQLHETFGLLVIGLTMLRLLWAMVASRPEPAPAPRWMQIASKATQGVLYLLLLAVPATAILGVWLEGDQLSLVGGYSIAPMLAGSERLGDALLDLHPALADAVLWLAGIHAAAALFHHHVMKDGVLMSMLPARSAKPIDAD